MSFDANFTEFVSKGLYNTHIALIRLRVWRRQAIILRKYASLQLKWVNFLHIPTTVNG